MEEQKNWLKQLREMLGEKAGAKSQNELARKTKLTLQTIQNYEAGRSYPTERNKVRLASAFGITPGQVSDAIDAWKKRQ